MPGFIEQPEEAINRKKAQLRPTSLRFPQDLGAHAMIMNFEKYDYANTRSGAVNAVSNKTIILPIPRDLNDDTTVDAQQAELGITGSAAYDLLSGGVDISKIGDDLKAKTQSMFGSDLSGAGSEALKNYGAFAKFAGRGAVDTLFPGAGLAANQLTGTAVNPYATIDFNGVRLKTHTFNWTLSPKSAEESETLKNIIKTIKQNILPKYESVAGQTTNSFSRALLTYPNLVRISFQGIDQDYYYKFKKSVIQNFNVRYNNSNQLQVFEGGKPVVVELSMQLVEAAIHTADDY